MDASPPTANAPPDTSRRHRRGGGEPGFTVVELMIAMVLSLIIIAGVLSVVFTSKVTYNENDRVARTQEASRAALDMILRDLRGAGFPGCAQPLPGVLQINDVLADSNQLLWNFSAPVQGFHAQDGGWIPALDPAVVPAALAAALPGSDVIAVRTVRTGAPAFHTTALTNPSDRNIVVSKAPTERIAPNSPVLISDCANATVFVASSFLDAGTTATLGWSTGGADPANSGSSLGAAFAAGAQITPVNTVIYYLAPGTSSASPSVAPGPSLWRIVGGADPEEVIPGVEALQIQYGVDVDGDTYADEYDTADVVDAAGNWSNVVSISLALLIRSALPNAPEVDGRQYNLLGTAFGPFNDHYERTLFTTTVALRERST